MDTSTLHCSFCGAELVFDNVVIRSIVIVPPCPRCSETTWLDEAGLAVRWPSSP